MRTTVTINDALLKRAKKVAAVQGLSLARLMEDALRRALDAPAALESAGVDLPVSTVGGGLKPGIDPSSNQSLWAALEDEDRDGLS